MKINKSKISYLHVYVVEVSGPVNRAFDTIPNLKRNLRKKVPSARTLPAFKGGQPFRKYLNTIKVRVFFAFASRGGRRYKYSG